MRRRTLLSGVAAAGAAAFAGCIGGTDDGDGGGPGTGSGGYEEAEIRTVSKEEFEDAAGGDERYVPSEATVTAAGDRIEIEGRLEAQTPCNEAGVADVERTDDALTVRVGLESSDEMCAQVISGIEYEATIVLEGELPASVVVIHEDRVGEVTAAEVDI